MGTYIKAALLTVCAVILAFAFRTVGVVALGLDPETNMLDDYADMMLEARGLFIEKSDDFQELAMQIRDMAGLCVLRRANGQAAVMLDGEVIPAAEGFARFSAEDPQRLAELSDSLCSGADVLTEDSSGAEMINARVQVYSIRVRQDSIMLLTGLDEHGFVAVCYCPNGTPAGLNAIELVEDWQIVYDMADTNK